MSETKLKWSVTSVQVSDVGELTDVITFAGFSCVATRGSESASVNYAVNIDPPTGDFTPFSQLTEEEVVQFVKSSLGKNGRISVETIEAEVLGRLPPDAPVVVSKPLPWSAA